MARRFRALIAADNRDTGDGRRFPPDAFTWRETPLSVMAQTVTPEFGGHGLAFVLGNMETIMREGDEIWALGTLNDEGEGQDADRRRDTIGMIERGDLNGMSVDPAGVDIHFECITFDEEGGWCTEEILVFDSYVIGAVTLVNVPAIDGTFIELLDSADVDEPEEADAVAASAAATLEHPPLAWFEMPEPDELTAFTITDDGQVYGHLSPREVCHIGMPGCVTQWESPTDFSYFHLCGPVRAMSASGEQVPVRVGPVSGSGGHYTTEGAEARNWRAAQAVYDDPRTCAAFVTAVNGVHGTWVRGALRHGATAEQVAFLRDFPPSGDWRRIDGAMELVGATSVVVPGFPNRGTVIAMAASAGADGGMGDLEPVAAIIGLGHAGRCRNCGGEHETPAHDAATASGRTSGSTTPAGIDARLARIESSVGALVELAEPSIRENLRARLRA